MRRVEFVRITVRRDAGNDAGNGQIAGCVGDR